MTTQAPGRGRRSRRGISAQARRRHGGARRGPDRRARDVGVLIPAYNAASTVGEAAWGSLGYVRDVVVVDDGSADETGEAAERAGALVIRHPENLGKGAALRTGFDHHLAAGAKAILTLDADGQHDPADIPRFLDAFRAQPIGLVYGNRFGDTSSMPWQRIASNRIGNFFYGRVAGQPILDSQTGYRLYPAALLRAIRLTTSRFDTETELFLRAARTGFPLVPVPIRTIYTHRSLEGSHYRAFADTVRIARLVLRVLAGW